MARTVLVTGATRGIGEAIARKFKAGGDLVIGTGTGAKIDVPEHLDAYTICDFSSRESIDRLGDEIRNLGTIDVLINNAGINKLGGFMEIDPDVFLEIQQVNVYAPFRLCQAVLPGMVAKGWGRIVNISSVWGKISKAGRASYSASKFGIDGLTLALANEFASKGILANCVAPGFIDTDMTRKNLGPTGIEQILKTVPINRLAQVEEVANLVHWLSSDLNSYMSGQCLAIDGGFTRA